MTLLVPKTLNSTVALRVGFLKHLGVNIKKSIKKVVERYAMLYLMLQVFWLILCVCVVRLTFLCKILIYIYIQQMLLSKATYSAFRL